MTELIKKILCNGKSLVAAVISLVILTVFRIFVLLNGIDYSTGLFGRDGNIYNIIYYILLGVCVAVIALAAAKDIKSREDGYAAAINGRGMTVIGIVLIATGSLQAIEVMNEFTTGLNIFSAFIILGCVTHIVGGVLLASSKKTAPAHSVIAIAVIIAQLGQMIEFYMSNFLISKNPQKLMMMLFMLTSTFFWIYFGRMLSGSKKFFPALMCTAGGLFSSALSLAYLISSFALLGIDAEKWIKLSYIPGLTLIPVMLIPGVVAAVVLLSGKAKTPAVKMQEEITQPESAEEEETAQ